jgi:hypothetical protein
MPVGGLEQPSVHLDTEGFRFGHVHLIDLVPGGHELLEEGAEEGDAVHAVPAVSRKKMIARRGFEPRITGPEPVVLPLHHRAKLGRAWSSWYRHLTIYRSGLHAVSRCTLRAGQL